MSSAQQATSTHSEETGERLGKWASLTDWARAKGEAILSPITRVLASLGVHPNTITIVGFLLQVGVGIVFGLGRIQLGGLLLVLVAPVDALDGALARATGRKTRFGAFLDSTLDRLSDAALILGLVAHHIKQGSATLTALMLVSLVAAMLVSYIRARAESLGFTCKRGLLTRMERVALIAILAALGQPDILAWALCVLSLITVVQRFVHVYASSRSDDQAS
ncbi:MAG: CDP-alcohol phosphatidyltransferase family protein [Anaerolineales bacterium]|nr:CDP-alcohol phosphatidyltransferase family protein [Anaerolineales bacterium]